MNNITIAKRISAGGTILLLFLAVVSTVAIVALSRLENFAGEKLRDDAIPCIVYSAEMTSQSLRGYIRVLMAGSSDNPEKLRVNIEKSDANVAETGKAMASYAATITSEEDRRNFNDLKTKWDAFLGVRKTYLDILKTGRKEDAKVLEQTTVEPAYFTFREQLAKVLKWNQDDAMGVANEMVRTSHRTKLIVALVAGIALLTACAIGWLIIRSTNRVLLLIAKALSEASTHVAAAAGQVSSSSQLLAEGSSEQAASLEETSASLEELSSMTKRNAESAGSTKINSSETRLAANSANDDMATMRRAMEAIKNSSNDISKIIKTIDEIAFQTNILALNAAVEAARAGEAGAGFAVVAEEVRALAQRSANSAKETAEKIEVAIRNGDQGALVSEKVAASLSVIVEKARKVDELVGEIANASQEQTQGIGQINTAVSQMDRVTQANAGNAEETAAAAEELNAQSISLRDAVTELQKLVGGAAHQHTRADAPGKPAAPKLPTRTGRTAPVKVSLTPARNRQTAAAPSGAADHSDFFNDH